MDDFTSILIFASAVCCAMVGGVLFAFSGFVMRALARIPAAYGMTAMQTINITVQHWLSSLLFFGTGLACIFLIVRAAMEWGEPGMVYVLAGGVLYVFAGLGVTAAFNVPLNNRLAKSDAHSDEGRTDWMRFVPVWLAWNHVRTVACMMASVSFLAGLLIM